MGFTEKNIETITKLYISGESFNAIAKKFNSYPTTIKRILVKQDIPLRHDVKRSGALYVKNGEQLIEWIKEKGRLVTKAELAKFLGVKRLSPSYFIKYPELGQYIVTHEQNELEDYAQRLYKWLQENNIKYKPNDRTKLKMAVTALLLDEYSNFILQLDIKPKCISKKKFEKDMREKLWRSAVAGMEFIYVDKKDFENLDYLKRLMDDIKNRR